MSFDFFSEMTRITKAHCEIMGYKPSSCYVEFEYSISGIATECEAEVTYRYERGFKGDRETPNEREAIEIISVKYGKTDITALITEKMREAITAEILGE